MPCLEVVFEGAGTGLAEAVGVVLPALRGNLLGTRDEDRRTDAGGVAVETLVRHEGIVARGRVGERVYRRGGAPSLAWEADRAGAMSEQAGG